MHAKYYPKKIYSLPDLYLEKIHLPVEKYSNIKNKFGDNPAAAKKQWLKFNIKTLTSTSSSASSSSAYTIFDNKIYITSHIESIGMKAKL